MKKLTLEQTDEKKEVKKQKWETYKDYEHGNGVAREPAAYWKVIAKENYQPASM